MSYKVAIFDLDGTILDTIEDLADSVNYALDYHNLPQRTLREIRSFLGNGIINLIKRSVGDNGDALMCEKVLATYRDYYALHCEDKTKPYEGIKEVLERLRALGIKTAVLSNKHDSAVQSLVADYFPGLFDIVFGTREGIKIKPAPDAVYEVISALGEEKNSCVYIGDSEVDVQTAVNAGTDMIIVTWGFRDEEFLISQGAKNTVSTMQALFDAITC